MDYIEIELCNWDKHNPRKDFKSPRWFAMSNRMLESAEFYSFSGDEIRAWLYVLSQASQKNSSKVQLYFEHADRVCRVNKKCLLATLQKLENIGAVQATNAKRTDQVQATNSTLQDNTEQNSTRQNSNAHAEAFALFWTAYPRKVGKEKSGKSYRKLIEAGLSPDEISKALANYLAYLRREKVDAKYIKHGPTFLNEVRDWLDPAAGQSESFATDSQEINWDKVFDKGGVA